MKVVAINGSARRDGNTAILIKAALRELEAEGIKTEMIELAGRRIRGCTACYKCFENKDKKCAVTEDAANEYIARMFDAGRRSVQERTLEQAPGFAFRLVVDIASRALSPAINDPTTAVLAIDQIHRLLRHVGSRQLDSGMICDSEGKLRLIVPAPRWEDFVCLAVSEIRLFGAKSLQVPRRLQAMLEHLIEVLPSPRAPALRQELALLHKAVDREYPEAEDRQRAETSDRQGLGGSSSQNV
jgi:uncharacterized membrane protein